MAASTNNDSREDALLLLAAEWRARKDRGLTPAEEQELVRWLEADSRHEDYFHQMGSTWELMDCAKFATPEKLGLSEETRARVEGKAKPVSRVPAWSIGLAAAAAVAFGWIGWTTWTKTPGAEFQQVAEAEAGYIKRMDLPDGSVIRMNSGTEVDVAYTLAERSVKLLRGEAHFEVAKNKERPFVVAAGGAAVRAVGTAFNVALKADSLEVLVTEGRVAVLEPQSAVGSPPDPQVSGFRSQVSEAQSQVSESRSPVFLDAGQRAVVSLAPESVAPVVAPVAPAEVAQELAWRDRLLEFDSAPLAEIVADFNRYNVHQIVIAPDSAGLGEQRFAGSFRADDPETFIKLIRMRTDVAVERNERETVLRIAR